MDPLEDRLELNQLVSRVWPARCSLGGDRPALLGPLGHTGVVALVVSGQRYIIDKGAPEDDDASYAACHRVGGSRVASLTREQLQPGHADFRWQLTSSAPITPRGRLTLRQLLRACGSGYDAALDNCWNGVERMLARAQMDAELDDAEFVEPLPWQAKLALGVGAAVGALAAFGAALSGAGGWR